MPVWLLKYLPHIVAVAALIGGVWWFSHSRYEAGYAAAEGLWQAKMQEAADGYAKELARQQALLEATAGVLSQARRDAVQQRDDLDETFRQDPVAGAWADTPVPASVQDRLRGAGVPADTRRPD